MPLLRFDIVRGRSPEQLSRLLDAAHEAMVAAFGVPSSDRYQIVQEHDPERLVAEDTGLGIRRSDDRVILQVTTRPRSRGEKETFYRGLARSLEARCGISPADLIVTVVTNTDEDWSFGHGRAQFLTGEL